MNGASPLHGVHDHGTATLRRRRRRTRVLATATAAMAVIAAGVVTAIIRAGSSSVQPSALAMVTSALTKTSSDSYRFHLDTTVQFAGREMSSDVVSGAFDPRHELGTEMLAVRSAENSAKVQIRFVDRYVYAWVSPGSGLGTSTTPWDKSPVPSAGTDVTHEVDVYSFATDQPVSPSALLDVLRSASTVREEGTASGPGWAGTKYAFAARFHDGREFVSGSVYVDQQGRVRRLMATTTVPKPGGQQGLTTVRDLTFDALGTPVSATEPPANQVSYTSTPPWGLYF